MKSESLTALVIGSGGREHALVNACLNSSLVEKVIAAPGNGGMQKEVECHPLNVEDANATIALAQQVAADLVIIGPEVPLALGVADALREKGFLVYGPGKVGALLEGSKTYCKQFLEKYEIPSADYGTFTEVSAALNYLDQSDFPLVVKASGLAAGKGVIICETKDEAEKAVREMLEEKVFGESGSEIVIEEFLEGAEASLMVLISDDKFVCLPPSQDHKRIGEGDTGLNTGGMGAYSPTDVVTETDMEWIKAHIIEPTIEGFKKEKIDFRGTLFVGLMMTTKGPKVLEYNVRFGDPECQVLLPLCETDPVSLLWDCARGELVPCDVKLKDEFAMIVVLAAKGYPGSYEKGDLIELPDSLPDGTSIIHAGTSLDEEGNFRSAGGRVLGVVARAKSLEKSAQLAYEVCDQIKWENKVFRRDIGWRQLVVNS